MAAEKISVNVETTPSGETVKEQGKAALELNEFDSYLDDESPSREPMRRTSQHPNSLERREKERKNPNLAHQAAAVREKSPTMAEIKQAESIPEKSPLERAIERIDFKLNKYADAYYVDGALESLSRGELETDPRKFVTAGFSRLEADNIAATGMGPNEWISFWTAFRDKVEDEDKLPVKSWGSQETKERLEGGALREALEIGAYTDTDESAFVDKTKKLHLALPILEHGDDGELQKFMTKYGIDFENENTQDDSENGFINILEAIKNDDDLTEDGYKALDWYFDSFHYGEHLPRFLKNMDEYYQTADEVFNTKLEDYLKTRPEVQEYLKDHNPKEERLDREEETIRSLADAEKITLDQLMGILDGAMQQDAAQELFPEPSFRELPVNHGNRRGNELKPKDHPSSIEKCTKIKQEVERILAIDPYASYCKSTDVFDMTNDGKKVKRQQYVILRFGFNDHNNVIAAPVGDESGAFFYGRFQTGDDEDGWREYFRNCSIRDRDPAVQRTTVKGYSKNKGKALDAAWDRIWYYLMTGEAARTSKASPALQSMKEQGIIPVIDSEMPTVEELPAIETVPTPKVVAASEREAGSYEGIREDAKSIDIEAMLEQGNTPKQILDQAYRRGVLSLEFMEEYAPSLREYGLSEDEYDRYKLLARKYDNREGTPVERPQAI